MSHFQTLLSISTYCAPTTSRAWFQLLKLKYDEPLSNVAFHFNVLRPYSLVRFLGGNRDALRRNFNPKSVGLPVGGAPPGGVLPPPPPPPPPQKVD